MYCVKCGYQIDPQDKFCAKCGSKVAQFEEVSHKPNPSPPEPEQKIAERPTMAPGYIPESVIWVFSAQRKQSLFKIIPCNIVFMQDKLIFAYLTPELQKAESRKLSNDIKSNGIGFLKGSAAMMKYWANFSKKYYTMTANEILSEDQSNAMIQYQNIQKVLFQCDSTSVDSEGITYGTQGKLQFDLFGGQTIKFTHSQWNDKSIRDMLIRLFGEKLKYKK